MSIFMPIPVCFDNFSCLLIIESSLNCYFPFQNSFSYLRTVFISIHILESALNFYKELAVILIGITMNVH